jgi:carbonic anhydrase/acetyltransferase-like protein (isoleucine patch superfamily)
MILVHRSKRPTIDPSAYVAPTAVVCGEVTIGPESCVGFGAVLVAEGAPLTIGTRCVIRENSTIRSVAGHPVRIGNNVLVGPGSSLSGCTIEDEAFLATGVTVFHDAIIKRAAEIRINAIVHIRTVVEEDSTVPIGWIAVGNPAKLFPPDRHDELWATLRPLNFPSLVYGVERGPGGRADMRQITERVTRSLHEHRNDQMIDGD